MPRTINRSQLNASTIDILNVIRTNASYQYQNQVPVITTENDIPKVGAIIYGNPAIANEFINALVNRIALVAVRSAVFFDPYVSLKKGFLEFGESIENVFVEIVKAMDFSAEKAESRELKRYLPKVHSIFHIKNWDVLYPITIEDEQLKKAFLTVDGVSDMIARIIDSVYTGASYDEYLLFKWLLIKSVCAGEMYFQAFDTTSDFDEAAIEFRAMSNRLRFMSNLYNEAGVPNTTPIDRQVIFMDADFNARFDVKTLAEAFNMEKADFIASRLYLIDSFTTFDNERLAAIIEDSTQIEPVTEAELTLMTNVKAILLDEEWFQVYDNLDKMTEKYVASGDRWNYFYHFQKTVSHSPYANEVCFVQSVSDIAVPDEFDVKIDRIVNVVDTSDLTDTDTVIMTLTPQVTGSLEPQSVKFLQTSDGLFGTDVDAVLVSNGIAVSPEGTLLFGKKGITYALSDDDAKDVPDVYAKIGEQFYYSDVVTVNEGEADEASYYLLSGDTVTGANGINTWTFKKVSP